MSSYPHVQRALRGSTWYVHEPKMREILAFLEMRMGGQRLNADALASLREQHDLLAARAQNVSAASSGSVAVIPVYGVICHRADMFSDFSGGTSTEKLAQQIRQAVNDPGVKAIVMDFDTPGGSTDGVDELATEIFEARKQKKITAVSNSLCASAGYYLAAQASEVVVSPSSITGSIGVYCEHDDFSESLAQQGVKVTLISYGENKTEGNSAEPLSDSARQHMQELVDAFGLKFEKAVARGRKITLADVQGKFGRGRVWTAEQAVKIGLADRVGTLDDVLGKYGVTRSAPANARAEGSVGTVASATRTEIEDGECSCLCESCRAGNCSACTHEDCDAEAEGCTDCPMSPESESTKAKIESAARERVLRLAGI